MVLMRTASMLASCEVATGRRKTVPEQAEPTEAGRLISISKVAAVLLSALSLAMFLSTPARSLSPSDVERVVRVIELLEQDLGDLAYDEDAADIWYEEDAAQEGRIAAAGFSRQTWREAVDRTVKGYLATLEHFR